MREEATAMTDHSTNRSKNTIKKRPQTALLADFIGNDSLPVSRENTPDLPGGAAAHTRSSRAKREIMWSCLAERIVVFFLEQQKLGTSDAAD